MSNDMNFRLHIRESFEDENGKRFIGPGVITLLENLEKERSLSKAAGLMDMSYTKALRIINHLEEVLELPILNRAHGGHERVGSSLTPFATKLIKEWKSFDTELRNMASPLAEKFLEHLRDEAKNE